MPRKVCCYHGQRALHLCSRPRTKTYPVSFDLTEVQNQPTMPPWPILVRRGSKTLYPESIDASAPQWRYVLVHSAMSCSTIQNSPSGYVCVCSTIFGKPVVPEVKYIMAASVDFVLCPSNGHKSFPSTASRYCKTPCIGSPSACRTCLRLGQFLRTRSRSCRLCSFPTKIEAFEPCNRNLVPSVTVKSLREWLTSISFAVERPGQGHSTRPARITAVAIYDFYQCSALHANYSSHLPPEGCQHPDAVGKGFTYHAGTRFSIIITLSPGLAPNSTRRLAAFLLCVLK